MTALPFSAQLGPCLFPGPLVWLLPPMFKNLFYTLCSAQGLWTLLGVNKVKGDQQRATWSMWFMQLLCSSCSSGHLLLCLPLAMPPPLRLLLAGWTFSSPLSAPFSGFVKQGSPELVMDPGFLQAHKRPFIPPIKDLSSSPPLPPESPTG